jgi:hypothetical protein
MSRKKRNTKPGTTPPIGKQAVRQQEEQTDFYHKHKSTIWTVIILIILAIFFVVNNTRKIPDEGPYPPNYKKANSSEDISR